MIKRSGFFLIVMLLVGGGKSQDYVESFEEVWDTEVLFEVFEALELGMNSKQVAQLIADEPSQTYEGIETVTIYLSKSI